jgi:hypothetical protein
VVREARAVRSDWGSYHNTSRFRFWTQIRCDLGISTNRIIIVIFIKAGRGGVGFEIRWDDGFRSMWEEHSGQSWGDYSCWEIASPFTQLFLTLFSYVSVDFFEQKVCLPVRSTDKLCGHLSRTSISSRDFRLPSSHNFNRPSGIISSTVPQIHFRNFSTRSWIRCGSNTR